MNKVATTLIAASAGIFAATTAATADTIQTYFDPYGAYDTSSLYGFEQASLWAQYYTNITGAYFGAYDASMYDYANPYYGYGYNYAYYYNPYVYDAALYPYMTYSPYYYYYGQ